MASAVATDKLLPNVKIAVYDHDPGSTNAIIASPDGGTTPKYLDMRDYGSVIVGVIQTVIGSSSGVTKLEIVADAAATFAAVEVIKDSGTIDADALADSYWLEATAEEINAVGRAAGKALRYVAARVTQSNAGDEAIVVYIGCNPRFAYDGLTANSQIS